MIDDEIPILLLWCNIAVEANIIFCYGIFQLQ